MREPKMDHKGKTNIKVEPNEEAEDSEELFSSVYGDSRRRMWDEEGRDRDRDTDPLKLRNCVKDEESGGPSQMQEGGEKQNDQLYLKSALKNAIREVLGKKNEHLSPKYTATKRSRNFSHEEILTLLSIWGDSSFQEKFKKMYRHSGLWVTIGKYMQDRGYDRDDNECKVKIGNLKAEYLRLKRNWKPGSDPPTWPYWDRMHAVLGGRPSVSELLDSLDVPECDPGIGMSPEGRQSGMEPHHDSPQVNNFCSSSDGDSDDSQSLVIDESAQTNTEEVTEVPQAAACGRERMTLPKKPGRRGRKRLRSSVSDEDPILQKLIELEQESMKLQEKRAENEARMMTAVTSFFSSMATLFTSNFTLLNPAAQSQAQQTSHNTMMNHSPASYSCSNPSPDTCPSPSPNLCANANGPSASPTCQNASAAFPAFPSAASSFQHPPSPHFPFPFQQPQPPPQSHQGPSSCQAMMQMPNSRMMGHPHSS